MLSHLQIYLRYSHKTLTNTRFTILPHTHTQQCSHIHNLSPNIPTNAHMHNYTSDIPTKCTCICTNTLALNFTSYKLTKRSRIHTKTPTFTHKMISHSQKNPPSHFYLTSTHKLSHVNKNIQFHQFTSHIFVYAYVRTFQVLNSLNVATLLSSLTQKT